jgi:hypothetical protein
MGRCAAATRRWRRRSASCAARVQSRVQLTNVLRERGELQ